MKKIIENSLKIWYARVKGVKNWSKTTIKCWKIHEIWLKIYKKVKNHLKSNRNLINIGKEWGNLSKIMKKPFKKFCKIDLIIKKLVQNHQKFCRVQKIYAKIFRNWVKIDLKYEKNR